MAGTWSNIWANGGMDYLLDFESLDSSASIAHGVSDVLQVEVEIEDRSRFGGLMDGFIQGFHDLFSIDQNGRDEVPRGDFDFDLRPGAGRPRISLDDGDRGSFSRNAIVTVQHNVTCGKGAGPAFSYALTARFPLSEAKDLEGGSSTDLGISISASRRFGKFYAYETLSVARFGKTRFRGIELRRDQISTLTALEWRFLPTMSFVLQYLLSEGAADDLGPFSRPSREITIGLKGEVARGTVLEVGLLENVITHDNSPDFGLHLAVSRRF